MGEAKRRKQLDANFGEPLYSKGGKAKTRHVLAPAPSPSADVDVYEQHVREVVQRHQVALAQNAQATRSQLSYGHKEADLCLVAMRTFDGTHQIRMKFARLEKSKRDLAQVLAQSSSSAAQIDSLFDEVVNKLSQDEFLWTHADIGQQGISVRLVPIENAEIARLCYLQTATSSDR